MLPWETGKEGKGSAAAVRVDTSLSCTVGAMARYPRQQCSKAG